MKRYLTILCLLLISFPAARADDKPVLDEIEFRDVANELRCPTCTGLSVLDSEAKFSVQIRNEVRKQMEDGRSKDEVLKFFTERYGAWILRSPPRSGVNALVWWVPIGLLVLGPLAVWIFVWNRKPVVYTGGIRSRDEIVKQMKDEIATMGSSADG